MNGSGGYGGRPQAGAYDVNPYGGAGSMGPPMVSVICPSCLESCLQIGWCHTIWRKWWPNAWDTPRADTEPIWGKYRVDRYQNPCLHLRARLERARRRIHTLAERAGGHRHQAGDQEVARHRRLLGQEVERLLLGAVEVVARPLHLDSMEEGHLVGQGLDSAEARLLLRMLVLPEGEHLPLNRMKVVHLG